MHLSIFLKKTNNYLYNRYRYLSDQIVHHNLSKSYPTFLSIEVASTCNLHCPECPVGVGKINRKNKLFNFEVYKKLMLEVGPYLHTLIFYFQGEPLINKNLEKYIELAHHYNIYTQTSTNAQLLTKERAEEIVKSKLHKLIISMDGATQESYQKYRIGGDINKCYTAIENIQNAKEKFNTKYPIIEAQMLVFKYNENELTIFRKRVKEKGANKVTFKSAQIYDFNKKDFLIPNIEKFARYKKVNEHWENKHKIKNRCLRQWSGAVITTDGDVLPCCYDKDKKYILGNINETRFKTIWCSTKTKKFHSLIYRHQNKIEMCQNCNF